MTMRQSPEEEYHQPILFDTEAPEETEFGNCFVISHPEYKDSGKKQERVCSVHAQPSIFQPDTDAIFQATARDKLAVQSRKKSLKPGDRAVLTGIVRTEIVTFPTGETLTINHLSLTKPPQLIIRDKRVSITLYGPRVLMERDTTIRKFCSSAFPARLALQANGLEKTLRERERYRE